MVKTLTMLLLVTALSGCASSFGSQAEKRSISSRATGPIQFLPGIAGDYFLLESSEVDRQFHIFINLPESYEKEPDRRFPVSYLLDGDSLFPMLAPQHLFLNYDEGLPEAIIVGIAYGGFDKSVNKRHIDFRPVLEDGSVGGSAKFLAMLEDELIPKIDAAYRTNPSRRTLFGQSRGGSFVLYTANERPELFHGYIASNPGREIDKRLYGVGKTSPHAQTNGLVIVTTGSRDRDYLREGAAEWKNDVAARSDLPWRAELVAIEGGTHAASAGEAYRAGMLRVYDPTDR